MTFDSNEFYVFADKAFAEANYENEGLFRIAIGRWYYAIFHNACTVSGISPKHTNNTHKRVQDYFIEKGENRIGENLAALHTLRCRADYHLEPSDKIGYQLANSARRYAKTLIEDLNTDK